MLASSRMPWAGGPPVEIAGRRYVDGGLGSAIPVAEALAAGATHVLVLQTRPHGVPRRSASRVADVLIVRHLRALNPALATLYRERVECYERVVQDIARRSLDGGGRTTPRARPAAAGRDAGGRAARTALAVLSAAARDAERLVERALLPAARPLAPANRRPGLRSESGPRQPDSDCAASG